MHGCIHLVIEGRAAGEDERLTLPATAVSPVRSAVKVASRPHLPLCGLLARVGTGLRAFRVDLGSVAEMEAHVAVIGETGARVLRAAD